MFESSDEGPERSDLEQRAARIAAKIRGREDSFEPGDPRRGLYSGLAGLVEAGQWAEALEFTGRVEQDVLHLGAETAFVRNPRTLMETLRGLTDRGARDRSSLHDRLYDELATRFPSLDAAIQGLILDAE